MLGGGRGRGWRGGRGRWVGGEWFWDGGLWDRIVGFVGWEG